MDGPRRVPLSAHPQYLRTLWVILVLDVLEVILLTAVVLVLLIGVRL
jgi:hypothetical protein